jgi:hypothetical protein
VSPPDCGPYRQWLAARAAVAAVAGTDPSAAADVPAGLDRELDAHLASCRTCRTEVEELALLSFAIRRAWADAGDVEPPEDSWPRLRERVSRRGPRSRLAWAASSIASVAMGTAIAIGVIAPLGIANTWGGDTQVVVDEAGAPTSPVIAARTSDDRAELDWMRAREATVVLGIGLSGIESIAGTGPRAVFATLRRDQSRYAEDRWDERPPGASEVPDAVVF